MSQRKMWDEKEDAMIRKIVEENDSRLEHEKWKWSDISEILQERIEGCVRSGKQCRERWFNHLDPAITQNRVLSDNQVAKLFELQGRLGNKWANIAKEFPGRTDSNLKNYFYSSLRRAVRQVNSYLSQYRKKSNIKPFKQTILAKVLKISDAKFREKLDIKSQDADHLAKKVKDMLAELSLSPEEPKVLTEPEKRFRDKLVQSIQQFNKNCKKRKQKRTGDISSQPDISDLSQYNENNHNDVSPPLNKNKHKSSKTRKESGKLETSEAGGKRGRPKAKAKAKDQKQISKITEVRKEEKEEEHKPLFRTPFNDCSFLKKLSHKKPSEMEEPQTQSRLGTMSFDLFRRNSGGEMEPIRMFTRRSSCEDNNKTPGFIYTIENWKRSDSKTQNRLFPICVNHDIDPSLLQSINIPDSFHKVNDSATLQSSIYRLLKSGSQTQQGNTN